MPLSQYEEIVSFDEVPDEDKDLVIIMLLDYLQLEVVKSQGGALAGEADVPVAYTVKRMADCYD